MVLLDSMLPGGLARTVFSVVCLRHIWLFQSIMYRGFNLMFQV